MTADSLFGTGHPLVESADKNLIGSEARLEAHGPSAVFAQERSFSPFDTRK